MKSNFSFQEEQTWRNFVTRLVLIIISIALIVWAMPHDNRTYYHLEKGKPWKYADVTAPFDFPVYKSDEAIRAEKDSLMKTYEPYYQYDQEKEAQMVKKFQQDFAEGIPELGPEYVKIISNRLHSLYQQGIMSPTEYSELRNDTARMIRIVVNKQANSVSIMEVYSSKTAYEQLFQDEMLALQRPILQKCNLNDYITPNLIYDRVRSETSINDMMSSIALATGVIQKGQKIVDRGEIVTDKTYRAIESFMKESERLHEDNTHVCDDYHPGVHLLPQPVSERLPCEVSQDHDDLCPDYDFRYPDGIVHAQHIHPCVYPSLCHGTDLRTCVHGLTYRFHGTYHHDFDLRRHAHTLL